MRYECAVCRTDLGWNRPSGVCSESCLRDAQGFPDGGDHPFVECGIMLVDEETHDRCFTCRVTDRDPDALEMIAPEIIAFQDGSDGESVREEKQ